MKGQDEMVDSPLMFLGVCAIFVMKNRNVVSVAP